MWHYLTFLPSALALIALVAFSTRNSAASPSPAHWKLAAGLWLLSWLATVVLLYSRGTGSLLQDFVAQREAGYWLGSAVMVALPFFVVAGVSRFLQGTPRNAITTRVALSTVALFGWLLMPGLFAMGWVTGCVLVGYQSCM